MDSIYMVMDYVEHDLKSLMEVLKSRKQFFLPGLSLFIIFYINLSVLSTNVSFLVR